MGLSLKLKETLGRNKKKGTVSEFNVEKEENSGENSYRLLNEIM